MNDFGMRLKCIINAPLLLLSSYVVVVVVIIPATSDRLRASVGGNCGSIENRSVWYIFLADGARAQGGIL